MSYVLLCPMKVSGSHFSFVKILLFKVSFEIIYFANLSFLVLPKIMFFGFCFRFSTYGHFGRSEFPWETPKKLEFWSREFVRFRELGWCRKKSRNNMSFRVVKIEKNINIYVVNISLHKYFRYIALSLWWYCNPHKASK